MAADATGEEVVFVFVSDASFVENRCIARIFFRADFQRLLADVEDAGVGIFSRVCLKGF